MAYISFTLIVDVRICKLISLIQKIKGSSESSMNVDTELRYKLL
jgi:hypothetical protein